MLRNYLSSDDPTELLSQTDTLAVLAPASGESSQSIVSTLLEPIGDDAGLHEIWKVDNETVESGRTDNCIWRRSKSLQFCAVSLPLSAQDDYTEVAYQAYSQILTFISASAHPELLRFWNYIPFINQGTGDAENYKRFCSGRLRAFTEHNFKDLQFPAASAVGSYQDGITVYALTSSYSPNHHTNPRQVDAFKYPRQYGPSSPSFARATTIDFEDQQLCFISGTASILGHNSVHRNDLQLQLYTTNDNILYLLKETGFKRTDVRTMRVYVRNQNDAAECQKIVGELFPDTTVIYLHADICRDELLAEIECFCVND